MFQMFASERSQKNKKKAFTTTSKKRTGGEDLISHLPDDCILHIGKFLHRKEIDRLMRANRRFYEIMNKPSMCRIKWMGKALYIYQIKNGYGFTQFCKDDTTLKVDGSKNKYYKFTYELEILFAEEELFLERRKICRNAYSSDKLKIELRDRKYHRLSVPGKIIEEIRHFLTTHSTHEIYFIHVTLTVLKQLGAALKRKEINEIDFISMNCERVSNELRCCLVELIKSAELKAFHLESSSNMIRKSLVNENFLTAQKMSNLCHLQFYAQPKKHYETRFYPSKSILPLLLQYKVLGLPSMILDSTWIVELLMMYLDSKDDITEASQWRIGMSRTIAGSDILNQIRDDYEYKRIDEMHQIIKKANGINAKFDFYEINLGDNERYSFIDIVFCPRDTSKFSQAHSLPDLRRHGYPAQSDLEDLFGIYFDDDDYIDI